MKKASLILCLIALLFPLDGAAQRRPSGYPMYYEVHDGDTTFFDNIDPVWVFPRGRRMRAGDWRRQYKLIYNFNKVYPYALVGRKMMHQVDSILAADVTRRSERNRYTHDVELELFRLFEKDLRNMTVTQGMVLMRLVDRECGMSPYEIIRNYRSGFAANFWQLVARMFGADLKRKYDPAGRDAKIEELVKIWDSGQWDAFYYSVFWEKPRKTVIKTDHLESKAKKSGR
ncbi:MAG: DUF4294 domain-containing protein [Bacteroidales bacterium]|nr:DUF4294 domain-containing protein [Bacteroidales bacterium]